MGMENISPELKASVDELKAAAESVQRPYKTKKPQQTQSDDALDDKSVKAAVGSPDTPHAPDSEHSIEVNSILPPQTADKKD